MKNVTNPEAAVVEQTSHERCAALTICSPMLLYAQIPKLHDILGYPCTALSITLEKLLTRPNSAIKANTAGNSLIGIFLRRKSCYARKRVVQEAPNVQEPKGSKDDQHNQQTPAFHDLLTLLRQIHAYTLQIRGPFDSCVGGLPVAATGAGGGTNTGEAAQVVPLDPEGGKA